MEYAKFFNEIRSGAVSAGHSREVGLVAWAKEVQKTLEDVKKIGSTARRSQSLRVGVSSRLGVKPVLAEIDAENQRIKEKQMQDFASRKTEKAFDPRTFYQNETYVYVVPHTHTDLGWLKTLKDYYEQGSFI